MNISNVGLSVSLNINALIAGDKWGGATGTGAALSFSFPWTSSTDASFSGYSGSEPYASFHYGLNAAQQAAARSTLQLWGDVANIAFSEIAETGASVGEIRFAFTSLSRLSSAGTQAWGWANFPNAYWPDGGDVWISTSATDSDWSSGSYNFEALLHELGHAMGIKHPFEGSPVLPSGQNSRQYTVMSYTDHPHALFVRLTHNANGSISYNSFYVEPDTPMLYDVAAIQYMYGANLSYRTGNDVYTFDPSTPFFRTIWDAGGTDTISVANFTKGCVIDLRQGYFSKITIESDSTSGFNWSSTPPTPTYDGTDNLAIAFGCVIENAIGGSGNDTFVCNDSNNSLIGGAGNDTAIFSDIFANYSFSYNVNSGTYTLSSYATGIDLIAGIETFQFSDVTKSAIQLQVTPPVLDSLSPVDNAVAVDPSANLVLTFNKAIQAGTGDVVIFNANGTIATTIAIADADQATISGNTLTINPKANLETGGSYYINMATGVLKDLAGNSFAGIADTATYNFTIANNAPTLTAFASVVAGGNEDTAITVSFADLQSQGNEADTDGTVNSFVIKALSSGTLKIGASADIATAWDAIANSTVDSAHNAYWTPAANANGILNAFTVAAKDNGGMESASAIQALVAVAAFNDTPVLATPAVINYTDTVFDDTFATVAASLAASDSNALTYSIIGGTDNGNGIFSKNSAYGVLSLAKATGAYSFAANDSAIELLTINASVSFTVTASDGALTDSKTLTVNIAQSGATESGGNDMLIGATGDDKFDGLAGNDTIDGSAGADTMVGGLGDDTYFVDDVNDVVTETVSLRKGGVDTVNSSVSYTLGDNLENLALTGTAEINGTGNALKNILTGNTGANILNGGLAADRLIGGLGNDTYYVDSTGDVVVETSISPIEIDTVNSSISYTLGINLDNLALAGTAALRGKGNALGNILIGNTGANKLDGGAGADTLIGGLGKDTLAGGLDADTFKFNNEAETGITSSTRDIIADFKRSQGDKIDLSAIDANTASAEDDAFSAPALGGIFSGAFTNPGELYFDKTKHILYGNNDADSGADFSIQLTGVNSLTDVDLVL